MRLRSPDLSKMYFRLDENPQDFVAWYDSVNLDRSISIIVVCAPDKKGKSIIYAYHYTAVGAYVNRDLYM